MGERSPNGIAEPSLKRNPATTCEAKVNINAIPCKTFNANVNCTLPVITAPTQLTAGIPLAAGDVFTAGDYKVTITEITSGSPSGYNGKGYVEQMKLIRVGGVSGAEPTIAKKVAVTLENTVVNDCYELASGKVVSAYDPNWGGVLDVDDIIELSNEIIDFLDNFKCDNVSKIDNYILNLTTYEQNILKNEIYSTIQKSQVSIKINELKTQLLDIKTQPSV